MIIVIISGGAGSRLWPISRQSEPKPFIKLSDGLSLLQNTFLRATQLKNVDKIITVTSDKIFFRIKDEYQAVDSKISCDFILEPFGRNTAAAILSACLFLVKQYDSEEEVLILPADHLITNFIAFSDAVEMAKKIAQSGYLVTFGITPEYPETGYGYIEADSTKPLHDGYLVKRFVEKPNLELAHEYLDSGDYLWNSGMFLGQIATFLGEFESYSPKLFSNVKLCVDNSKIDFCDDNNQVMHLNDKLFLSVENISIDYALFEKSSKIAVIPCAINWSDIGSWLSISEVMPKDKNGNTIIGESILHNVTDCLIHANTNRVVAVVDVNNLIVIDTADAVLVADKQNSQNVRHIFDRLKSMKHNSYEFHQTIHNVWGSTTIIENNDKYTISKVVIKPNCKLELTYNTEVLNRFYLRLTILEGELVVNQQEKQNILHIGESLLIPSITESQSSSKVINYLLKNMTKMNVVYLEVKYK